MWKCSLLLAVFLAEVPLNWNLNFVPLLLVVLISKCVCMSETVSNFSYDSLAQWNNLGFMLKRYLCYNTSADPIEVPFLDGMCSNLWCTCHSVCFMHCYT